MKYDYIFFDSGGTLYSSGADCDPSPAQVAARNVERVHALLSGIGLEVDFDLLDKETAQQTEVCQSDWGKGFNFFRLMKAVVKELGLPLGPEEAACLADAYAGPRYAQWLFPGTRDALQALRDDGYRLGVIANTSWPGFCMDRAFAGVGLLPFFDIRIYSGDIGIAKPDPAIFRLAERMTGIEGDGKRILYVGNDLQADIEGASGVGWATAFRRGNPSTTEGLADFEFYHIAELLSHCLD